MNNDTLELLKVIDDYDKALSLLDDYDHQVLKDIKGKKECKKLEYDECRMLIDKMNFNSSLFGVEKDSSFKSSINAIYQTAFGEDVYKSVEEKAANLLYFITKNHSFIDGNKRIAASCFLMFLHKNNLLYKNGYKIIDDNALVAITILIAESRTEEHEIMVKLILNMLNR
jgi:prophage maintenance system killer protein